MRACLIIWAFPWPAAACPDQSGLRTATLQRGHWGGAPDVTAWGRAWRNHGWAWMRAKSKRWLTTWWSASQLPQSPVITKFDRVQWHGRPSTSRRLMPTWIGYLSTASFKFDISPGEQSTESASQSLIKLRLVLVSITQPRAWKTWKLVASIPPSDLGQAKIFNAGEARANAPTKLPSRKVQRMDALRTSWIIDTMVAFLRVLSGLACGVDSRLKYWIRWCG